MKDVRPKRGYLAILLILLTLLHVAVGSYIWIAPNDLVQAIFAGPGHEGTGHIVWALRIPRAIGCVLVGCSLAWVGALYQAFFRNPLAEPFVLGVSSGAAVGSSLVLVLGGAGWLLGLAMPAAGFISAYLALVLLLGLVGSHQRSVANILIAGAVLGSMLAALLSLVLLFAGRDTNQVLRWLMGSVTELRWPHLASMAVILAFSMAVLLPRLREINAMAVGEQTAMRLGVDVERLKVTLLIASTLPVAATVASAGIVGFVGLVAPHLARRLTGNDLRRAAIDAALIGGALVLAADLLAQRLMPAGELPIGAVTAVLGSPFLLGMLRKSREQ
ncbi:MAG: Hemin transport system permease protein HmuU [Fimbriimonadaceae bacterium]|nr:Hemin transport system permease protein HmuU [Fimbriimonadaceae bacterium]